MEVDDERFQDKPQVAWIHSIAFHPKALNNGCASGRSSDLFRSNAFPAFKKPVAKFVG